MTKDELIAKLQDVPGNPEVMILDGFNGGGFPRDINLGPIERTITENDTKHCADCEDFIGSIVFVIGYGYY